MTERNTRYKADASFLPPSKTYLQKSRESEGAPFTCLLLFLGCRWKSALTAATTPGQVPAGAAPYRTPAAGWQSRLCLSGSCRNQLAPGGRRRVQMGTRSAKGLEGDVRAVGRRIKFQRLSVFFKNVIDSGKLRAGNWAAPATSLWGSCFCTFNLCQLDLSCRRLQSPESSSRRVNHTKFRSFYFKVNIHEFRLQIW